MAERDIRVLIADDHRLFREGLAALLDGQEGVRVEGEAANGREAVEQVLVRRPDVAVLDIRMPGVDGIEATRRISDATASTQIVVLTGHHSEAHRRQAFEAGARAYLGKECSVGELVQAIRHAARGDFYLAGPEGQEIAADFVSLAATRRAPGGAMTPREREIAVLLADGYSTKEAAAVLGISVRTAEAHRASIMRKLDARNVADVVKYCIRNRLVDL